MGKRARVLLLLVVMASIQTAGAVLSGCGGGDNETGLSSRAREAVALLERPDLSQLTEAERDSVISALREALGRAGKVHIGSTLDTQDIVFGADGHVAMMRTFGTVQRQAPDYPTPEASQSETILVYDGPPVRYCDGREDSEMVMVRQYVFSFGQWEVSAKAIGASQVPFELLFSRLDLSVAEDAGFSEDGGRRLRGLSVPFAQPGDPEATVTVWVDLEDGLIRRVDTSIPGAPGSTYPLTFDYGAPIDVEVPSEPAAPDCVPVQQSG